MGEGDGWRVLLSAILTKYMMQTPPEGRDELVSSLRLLAR